MLNRLGFVSPGEIRLLLLLPFRGSDRILVQGLASSLDTARLFSSLVPYTPTVVAVRIAGRSLRCSRSTLVRTSLGQRLRYMFWPINRLFDMPF